MTRGFICEPEKNKSCPKTHCWWNGGECKITSDRAFATDGEQTRPKPWCCHLRCPHIGDGVSCDECRLEYMEEKR